MKCISDFRSWNRSRGSSLNPVRQPFNQRPKFQPFMTDCRTLFCVTDSKLFCIRYLGWSVRNFINKWPTVGKSWCPTAGTRSASRHGSIRTPTAGRKSETDVCRRMVCRIVSDVRLLVEFIRHVCWAVSRTTETVDHLTSPASKTLKLVNVDNSGYTAQTRFMYNVWKPA